VAVTANVKVEPLFRAAVVKVAAGTVAGAKGLTVETVVVTTAGNALVVSVMVTVYLVAPGTAVQARVTVPFAFVTCVKPDGADAPAGVGSAAAAASDTVKVPLVAALAADVEKWVASMIAVIVVPGGKPPPDTEAPTTRPVVLATVTVVPAMVVAVSAAVPGVVDGGTYATFAPGLKVVALVPAFELPAAL
jgi:hypothetical protein